MSLTTQEPSTKFYGPNRRYQKVQGNNVRVIGTVFNLQPGDTWNPAFEAELLTPRILVPHLTAHCYIFVSTNFFWALFWDLERTEYVVRRLAGGQFAFRFNPVFGVHSWCINELTGPTGNYAYGGTGTISWFEV